MADADTILAQLNNEPSAPSAGAPAAVADAPEPSPTPEVPRQPDGRFAERPTEPTAEAQPDAEPEGEGEPSAEPDPDIVPWVLETQTRGEPTRIEIPGALYKPGQGVFIPDTPEAQGQFRQMLVRGARYERVQQQNAQLREQLTAGVTRHQLENQAMAAVLKDVLNPDFITQAALDPEMTIERLQLKLQRAALDLERQHGGALVDTQANPREALESAAYALEESFEDVIGEVAPGLDPDARAEIEAAIAQTAAAYVSRTRGGGVAVNRAALQDMVTRLVRSHTAGKPAPRRAAPKPVSAVPPAAGGAARNLANGGAKPNPTGPDAPFRSKADVDAYFGR